MIRVDIRPRARNSNRRAETKSCPGHLKWLRGRCCALEARGGCSGRIVAAHVDHAGGKGIGTKVADYHAIPLCDGHHREQHQRGWASFELAYSFDAVVSAAVYWRTSPHRAKFEARS